ncbi:MAG: hypothetical protein U1D30_09665 [Planctomycetota bacterium]
MELERQVRELEYKIQRLERRNRSLNLGFMLGMAIALGAFVTGTVGPNSLTADDKEKTVSGTAFVLTSPDGKPVTSFVAIPPDKNDPKGTAGCDILDAEGNRRIHFYWGKNQTTTLAIYNGRGGIIQAIPNN